MCKVGGRSVTGYQSNQGVVGCLVKKRYSHTANVDEARWLCVFHDSEFHTTGAIYSTGYIKYVEIVITVKKDVYGVRNGQVQGMLIHRPPTTDH